MKFTTLALIIISLSLVASLPGIAENAHAQSVGKDACAGPPTGRDVFSIGEVRTSILKPTPFQELNGPEWVLMDGSALLEPTALSPHLPEPEEGSSSRKLPDARGRFLRMVNNDACANFRDDAEEYCLCIADRDPDDDRLLGSYQADAFGVHRHTYNDIYYSESPGYIENIGGEPPGTRLVDIPPDGWRIGYGPSGGAPSDNDNDDIGWDRITDDKGRKETVPKNVAVNFYIKICKCRTRNCR